MLLLWWWWWWWSTSERQKVAQIPSIFDTFDLEICFAPQRRAPFFDLWTSKSGPNPSSFDTFDLEMCFAPQRRALFRQLNFQKWSEREVLLPFWLGNVLVPQRRAIFHLSSDQLAPRPPLERGYCSTLRSPKSLEKHSESRLSYLFAHLHLLSSDFLHLLSSHFLTSPSWLFPPLLFHFCILSEVWLLTSFDFLTYLDVIGARKAGWWGMFELQLGRDTMMYHWHLGIPVLGWSRVWALAQVGMHSRPMSSGDVYPLSNISSPKWFWIWVGEVGWSHPVINHLSVPPNIHTYIHTYIHTCHAMPCHAMPCHAMPCHAMPCHTIPYHTYHALHCITLHYITLHYITLHYTKNNTCIKIHTLQYIHSNTYIAIHTKQYIQNNTYITWHDMTWHYITLHCITLHYIHTIHTIHTLQYLHNNTYKTIHTLSHYIPNHPSNVK